MATKLIKAYSKSVEDRPGQRTLRARKVASRIVMAFSALCLVAMALMFAKLQIPGLDVPGLAWAPRP